MFRTQALLVVTVGVVTVFVLGTASALAVVGGGAAGIVLTAVAALRAGSSAESPDAMIGAFYRAMALKLVLAVVLFVIVALWFAAYFGPILVGYVLTLLANWLALWRLARLPGPNRKN
ncbi:MAG: ATP synthase subunit I [Wenzhouxiangellaceae bacterium]